MTYCPHCHRPIDTESTGPTPTDGAQAHVAQPSPHDWIGVARLQHVADVGFFCDMLSEYGIETRIHEDEEFSAVVGSWQRSYIVQVSPEDHEQAVRRIRDELDPARDGEDDAHDGEYDAAYGDGALGFSRSEAASGARVADLRGVVLDRLPGEGPSGSGALWKPALLVLIAGGLAVTWVRGCSEAPVVQKPANRPREQLWQALSESKRPMTTPAALGAPYRRLSYDAKRHRFVLEEDTDGDGIGDRRREFYEDGSARDLRR